LALLLESQRALPIIARAAAIVGSLGLRTSAHHSEAATNDAC
jgi:hypothetical protein